MRTQMGISTEKSGLIPEFFLKKVIKLIKNIWINMTIIIAVFALFTGIVGAQDSIPNFPVGLQGSITIGDNPAPPGTVIVAQVGDTGAGTTVVQIEGVYGDNGNDRLGVSANDGDTVNFYVNGVLVPGATFVYHSSDATAGKIFRINLNAPASAVIPTGGGGSGGTPGPASTQSSAGVLSGGGSAMNNKGATAQIGTGTAGSGGSGSTGTNTPITSSAATSTAEFNMSAILGVFALLVVAVTVGLILRMRPKLKRDK